MKLHDEYIFNCTLDKARSFLLDENNIILLVPHFEKFEKTSQGEYYATIPIKIFFFKTKLSVNIQFLEPKQLDCRSFVGEASGKLGDAHVKGEIQLFAAGEKTRLVYEADILVKGSFADKAELFIESSGKDKMKKGLDAIAKKIETENI